MDRLTFRLTVRQLCGLGFYVLFLAGVAVALVVTMVVRQESWGSGLAVWAIGAGLVAVAALWALVMCANAFTEFTPAGIRTRLLTRTRSCSWAEVEDIVRMRQGWYGRYYEMATVIVMTTSGRRFQLGAPVHGGVMRDREFAAKFAQIQQYWQANRAGLHA